MTTNMEQILEDLANHKITKEEAKARIDELKHSTPAKTVKVHITKDNGKVTHIALPIGVVNWFLPSAKLDFNGVNVKEMLQKAMQDPTFTGEVCKVTDDDGSVIVVTLE